MQPTRMDSNGIAIQVEDHGGAGDAVLFIHHGGSNLRMWDRVIPFFADTFRCITLDLRGHGRSDAPQTGYHIDDMHAIGTVVDRGAEISVPWLLIHGTADTVVPLQDSIDILQRAGDDAELVQLEGVDHVFSGAGAARMTDAVVRWLCGRA